MLLITVDTLRADALGVYGRRQAQTPWIDRLANAGVRFDRARAHNVVTLPSHANILSGRYPFQHGVRDNAGFRFPAAMPSLATLLKARGFRTAAFVSAFPLDSRFGLDRGFDVYDDGFGGAGAQHAFLVQERAAAETVARAMRWLDAQSDAPSLCWVHIYEPHFPYAPPEPLASQFKASPYDGEVAATDLALRPLLEPILTAGRDAGTLVVFTSDHGESLGEHGEATHGIFAYEPTLRVPLIVFGANLSPGVIAAPVGHIDVLPTILELLAVPGPPDLAGRSLVPLARGATLPPRTEYFEALSGELNRGWAPLQGVLVDETKFISLPIAELYDLRRDPAETRNRANEEDATGDFHDELSAVVTERRAEAVPESAETRERLRSLGYLGGSGARRKNTWTDDDDPKRLVGLDTALQQVVGRYLDGDARSAVEQCRALVRQRPDMAVSWLHLAHLERETGDIKAGIDALEKAASLNGDDAETIALLGAYLTDAGRPREAIDRLRPSASREPSDVGVLTSYALALARVGDTTGAIAALATAQRVDPSDAMLHVHRGTVELMGNNRVRAREEFEAALERSPDLPRAHSSLGILLAEDGRVAEAIDHWNRATASDPREYRTVLGIGLGLAQRGNAAAARPYLEYFARHAPSTVYPRELDVVRRVLAGGR